MDISSFGAITQQPQYASGYSTTGLESVTAGINSGQTFGSLLNTATSFGGEIGGIASSAIPIAGYVPLDDAGVSNETATPLATEAFGVWNFIVAPEDISWDTSIAASRVDMFGTNSPPVIAGTKGMRDLNIGNAMIEGFTRSRTVEGRVAALEELMKYTLNAEKGFVNVPVYNVCANEKRYGASDGGCFIIKDVRIKETMRDLDGKSTRAFADISLIQVPKYQVDRGVDQASAAINPPKSFLDTASQLYEKRAKEEAARAAQAQAQGRPPAGAARTPAAATQGVGSPSKPTSGSQSAPRGPVPSARAREQLN